ncbi:class I SAM-dependent methyltransferase [Microvirga roseola]|uniref:class I SAM-dependent methyltransferase n=1 Tax=Microvirga roseola TaxID=2883126 RepID=UPI001E47900C|nr:class I SAM-dependent methyltransferase [Microvirga roseola]
MTRLDSAIRRLTAQRDLLNWATEVIAPTGLVLELGLGNGRTYDHLRTRLPGREIYAFERSPAAHPDCIPPDGYLIVGDIFDTLPSFIARFGKGSAALVHTDIGTGDEDANRILALRLSPLLDSLLQPGGLLLADRAFEMPSCMNISSKTGVPEGRYFVYRRET